MIKKMYFIYLLFSTLAFSAINHPLVRYPDVSDTCITFVYAGDIWIVSKTGGIARRITSPSGEEQYPKFSADGKSIAFSGNYDGNIDIYIISINGGVPLRLTHHPAPDRILDWFPDGKHILLATRMTSERINYNQLYKISTKGGLPVKLPVPYGETAAVSPDGKTLAFTLMPDYYSGSWKRYQGGRAPDIWLINLQNFKSKNITNFTGVDSMPMWYNNTIYFISERGKNKRANIWAYEEKAGKMRQVTFFEKFDVMYPSIGPKDIVFENGGGVFLLELATEMIREVTIKIATDQIKIKQRIEEVSDMITTAGISPTGQRALFEARGEIFTVPARQGIVYNLTRTPGTAERYPAWSPDGKYIAYFSDRSGEYDLYIRDSGGEGKETRLAAYGPGFRYLPHWSPDSKKIVFIDNTMTIRLYYLDTGKTDIVDRGLWMLHRALERFTLSWSSDSRFFAYSRGLQNRNHAIFIFDTKKNELHQVTSGYYNDFNPVFDPEGLYLYLFSSRTLIPLYSDLQESWIYPNTTNIAAIPLNKKIPSPLTPHNDVEKKVVESNFKNRQGDSSNKTGPDPAKIDLEKFESRLVILPLDAGNYAYLQASPGKVVYLRRPRTGASGEKNQICYFDLNQKEEKKTIKGVERYALSNNKKRVLVQMGKDFSIIDFPPVDKIKNKLAIGEMMLDLNPKQEWRQIFKDVWRYQRDFFYDPHLHGLDWNAVGKRYEALIENAGTREDVNAILRHLVGELGAGHIFVGRGETEKSPHRGVGMLGIDFSLENGAYRIKQIIDPGPRVGEIRSPLTEPGVDVKEGDYILAVNHIPLDTDRDPWAAFQGLAGKDVLITVNSTPDFKGARKITVKTLKTEYRLRELAWVEKNRKKVSEMSSGRIGYIYVPNTSQSGQNDLVRQFIAQIPMEGLVIDERFNRGGSLGARLVELLNRPSYIYLSVRNGEHFHIPEIAHTGPKALLINGWSVSGGDGFPFFFKTAGIGPVIGTRTTGAFIGPNQPLPLVDGGLVSAPPSRIYNLKGQWQVENHGTEPDIPLINDPGLMAQGQDPQLERAVQVVLKLLDDTPVRKPNPPQYPRHN